MGRPFSTRVIEGEISASIRDSSTTRAPTRLDDVRQNTLRLSGSGKVEGAFHVDAEKVVPMMAEKHVQIIDDGKSAKVAQWSQLSRHAPSNVATAEAQVLSSLMHDAKKVAGNNIVVKALLAGGAMVTAGAASAMDAPEGQKLEAGFKGAVKAGAEHLVPGITEKDKCVAQGKSWGNVGAAFGAAGLTGGVAFFTGGVGLVGGVATSAIGGGAGQIIGEALGEGVCRLAQSAKEGISSENLAMIKHRPTTQTVASTKTPDSSVTQAPSQGVAASRG